MIINLALAKSVFQVRGVDVPGKVVVTSVDRDDDLGFLNNLAPSDLFAMPAPGSPHRVE
jgi:hypothetical protein